MNTSIHKRKSAQRRPRGAAKTPAKDKRPAREQKNKKRPKRPKIEPPPDDLPYWLAGDWWESLSPKLQQAARQVLAPAYRQFVLEAPNELERTIGVSLVHLIWLEVIDQANLLPLVSGPNLIMAALGNPEQSVDRHLHLVLAKCNAAELLLKLKMFTAAMQRQQSQDAAIPAVSAAAPLALLAHDAAGDAVEAEIV